ncbi:ABC transporter permease subunit [Natronococcus sp. A-GB7]|uniref:sugar ABC transporter permease n=1 Tax=Natronococcus sp. A-GB7 TaxID=3037649 RepID=UPI00241E4C53|nr:ABC transporter permease subunit [Natronococcus sp. A-GB7]MDG5817286.1 ABC transporter permease subunit [Natronococcus sp. A-GB7]
MTVREWFSNKIRNDVRTVVQKPAEWREDVAYTVDGMRRGTIDPLDVAKTVLATLATIVFVFVLLIPVYWIFIIALQGEGATLYSTDSAGLIPSQFDPAAFVWVIGDIAIPGAIVGITIPFTDVEFYISWPRIVFLDASNYVDSTSDFPRYFRNSMFISFWTVVFAMLMIVPAAYAFSRREFAGRMKLLYGYILFTQVGAGLGIASVIALYTIFSSMGVTNNRLVLSFYYAAMAVPFNTWLLKTYMDSIPTSLEEAAIMDGASPFRVAWEVVLPLAKPGIATIFIFIFLVGWMEFIIAQLILSPEHYTLPVGLFALIDEHNVPWGQFAAFALVYASPVVFIYMFAQRYIEDGFSFGGTKG